MCVSPRTNDAFVKLSKHLYRKVKNRSIERYGGHVSQKTSSNLGSHQTHGNLTCNAQSTLPEQGFKQTPSECSLSGQFYILPQT